MYRLHSFESNIRAVYPYAAIFKQHRFRYKDIQRALRRSHLAYPQRLLRLYAGKFFAFRKFKSVRDAFFIKHFGNQMYLRKLNIEAVGFRPRVGKLLAESG